MRNEVRGQTGPKNRASIGKDVYLAQLKNMRTQVANRRIITLFAPSPIDRGGAGRRSQLLAQSFEEEGYFVVAIFRRSAGIIPKFTVTETGISLDVPGFRVQRLGAALYLALAIPLGYLLRRRTYAVLSVQMMSTAVAASILRRWILVPWLMFTSTSGLLSEAVLLQKASKRRQRAFSRADLVIAQTEYVASEFLKSFPNFQVRVVPNPVRVPEKKPLGRPLEGLRFIYAGRFSTEKGLDTLISAWKEANLDPSNFSLSLFGQRGIFRPISSQDIQSIKMLEAEGSVRICGWKDELAQIWQNYDVLILPSRSEGMSNALLEAMANGLPVIASDIEPNIEVLGEDYPGLFLTGDANDLCRAIQLFANDHKVRMRSRSHVREKLLRFDYAKVSQDLIALINEVREGQLSS